MVKKTMSLKKNFSWAIGGNLVAAICKWGILVILAKLGTAKLVGQFTLAYALIGPVFMFANLQLRAVQATDVKNDYKFIDYFKLRTITNIISILTVTFILLPILKYDNQTANVVFLVTLIKLFESFSDVIYGQMQKHERMDVVSKSMIIREVIGLLIFTLILSYSNSLLYSLLGFTIVSLLVMVSHDLVLSFKVESTKDKIHFKNYINSLITKWNFSTLKTIFLISLPLGLGVFIGSLVTNVPRYLVEYFLGQESLGYFAAISYFAIGFSTLFNAIGQATRPRLSKYFEMNFDAYKKLLFKLIKLSGTLGLLFYLFSFLIGKELLSLVYSPDYSQYWSTLIWVSLAVFFLSIYNVLQVAIQSARVFNVQIYISIISLFSAIASGYVLVPKYGVEGGGMTLFTYSIVNTITAVYFFLKFVYQKRKTNS